MNQFVRNGWPSDERVGQITGYASCHERRLKRRDSANSRRKAGHDAIEIVRDQVAAISFPPQSDELFVCRNGMQPLNEASNGLKVDAPADCHTQNSQHTYNSAF